MNSLFAASLNTMGRFFLQPRMAYCATMSQPINGFQHGRQATVCRTMLVPNSTNYGPTAIIWLSVEPVSKAGVDSEKESSLTSMRLEVGRLIRQIPTPTSPMDIPFPWKCVVAHSMLQCTTTTEVLLELILSTAPFFQALTEVNLMVLLLPLSPVTLQIPFTSAIMQMTNRLRSTVSKATPSSAV